MEKGKSQTELIELKRDENFSKYKVDCISEKRSIVRSCKFKGLNACWNHDDNKIIKNNLKYCPEIYKITNTVYRIYKDEDKQRHIIEKLKGIDKNIRKNEIKNVMVLH